VFKTARYGRSGSAGLARALSLGLGAGPHGHHEARSEAPVVATLDWQGGGAAPEDLARVRRPATSVPFPTDPAEAAPHRRRLARLISPGGLVVIEKTANRPK